MVIGEAECTGAGQTGRMELFEIEMEQQVTREEAAAWLRKIADQLERHNEISIDREGMRMRIAVPTELTMEIEVEIGSENSLEIELNW